MPGVVPVAKIIRLVPKLPANDETVESNVLSALELGVETAREYIKNKQCNPHYTVVMLCSDNPDGSIKTEYITANLGRFAAVGMIETIKYDLINGGEL